MLIINADDFGKNLLATDRIVSCCKKGRVTSTSAMVFMEDSRRAADLARVNNIDVGLHINLTQRFTERNQNSSLSDSHERIAKFLTLKKYNFLIYNITLRNKFKYIYQKQLEEFERLYEMSPSHIDGHHHMHLCTNILFQQIIPKGEKVRRNFSFAPSEKSLLNRTYRSLVDKWLVKKYILTDYFFSLSQCLKTNRICRVFELAKTLNVELQTHPEIKEEYKWLMSDDYVKIISNSQIISYSQLTM